MTKLCTEYEIMVANRKVANWGEDYDPFYGAPVILIVLAKKMFLILENVNNFKRRKKKNSGLT